MLRLVRHSSALFSSRRALSVLLSLRLPSHHSPSPSRPPSVPSGVPEWRGIHSCGGGLPFKASEAVRAQYAVDDLSAGEEKKGGDEEGLDIAKLGISSVIANNLSRKGISKLFPIQRAVLEPAMLGCDIIGRARTGTGKTLAFAIPIMDKIIQYNLRHGRGRNPLALALTPTRELARQVEKEFRESSNLDSLCAYGGLPIHSQMRALDYGVDIVVGTPGRIIDLLKRGALNLSDVQFLVLDEADEMLAIGFAEAVEAILSSLPKKRQTLMFSATMPSSLEKITRNYLEDPVTIDLVGDSDKKIPKEVTLYSIASHEYGRACIVGQLVSEHCKGGKCIIFTRTKREADQLSYQLGTTLRCEPLHGDISQSARERTLSDFRSGRFNVLVATDVAARGLDIPNVDLVIHYDLPDTPEIFVHRSGRTGRAGKKGSVIAIYTDNQFRDLRMIEHHVGCTFQELPKINVEDDVLHKMHAMASSCGGGGYGRFGYGRSGGGGYGRSGYGRSGGGEDLSAAIESLFATGSDNSRSSRSVGFGSSFGQTGGFGSPASGHFRESGSQKGDRSSGDLEDMKMGGNDLSSEIESLFATGSNNSRSCQSVGFGSSFGRTGGFGSPASGHFRESGSLKGDRSSGDLEDMKMGGNDLSSEIENLFATGSNNSRSSQSVGFGSSFGRTGGFGSPASGHFRESGSQKGDRSSGDLEDMKTGGFGSPASGHFRKSGSQKRDRSGGDLEDLKTDRFRSPASGHFGGSGSHKGDRSSGDPWDFKTGGDDVNSEIESLFDTGSSIYQKRDRSGGDLDGLKTDRFPSPASGHFGESGSQKGDRSIGDPWDLKTGGDGLNSEIESLIDTGSSISQKRDRSGGDLEDLKTDRFRSGHLGESCSQKGDRSSGDLEDMKTGGFGSPASGHLGESGSQKGDRLRRELKDFNRSLPRP